MGQRRYQTHGFIPIVSPPARITRQLAAGVTVVKGDTMIDNGSGYATNTAVLFADTILGVAAASVDDSGGVVAGAKNVEIYPLDDKTLYIVPVGSADVIDRGDIGVYADLETNDDIDIIDYVVEGLGFFIEDIDISDEAIAANTAGYAIGRFRFRVVQDITP